MVESGSPKPVMKVRFLPPLQLKELSLAGSFLIFIVCVEGIEKRRQARNVRVELGSTGLLLQEPVTDSVIVENIVL